ncbi:hypothetical protein HRbin40_00766 [bacterium HR40]|nr:hypothetical protein HRbin40_00766 [bacterium HR40]
MTVELDPLLVSQLTAFVSVVLIDIVLAGDNAVVVGTAAAGLPPHRQRQVIAIGVALALVARIAFALVAVQLLTVIGLVFAGGLLLLWVAWKMWREMHPPTMPSTVEAESAEEILPPREGPAKTFGSAVLQVTVADISMSLDNILAVAGAAREHPYIMAFGLLLSIALMGVAAGYIARLIDRYHWVAYVGLAIVVWVALDMIWEGGLELWHAGVAAGLL